MHANNAKNTTNTPTSHAMMLASVATMINKTLILPMPILKIYDSLSQGKPRVFCLQAKRGYEISDEGFSWQPAFNPYYET